MAEEYKALKKKFKLKLKEVDEFNEDFVKNTDLGNFLN